MTKPEDTHAAAGGSPLDGGVRALREGEVMMVYMDFDRRADKTLAPAAYLLQFGLAVSARTVQANAEVNADLCRLRGEIEELDDLRERMADLLSRTAVALRGREPPLTRWGWHDLPERAAAAVAAIDVMQRAAFMAADPERPNARLTGPQRPTQE